jgi:hypothetical protein
MHYSRIITVVALGFTMAACANSDPEPADETPASPAQAERGTPAAEQPFEFAIAGRDQPMQGQARFKVLEGTPEIKLTIVGGDVDDNLLQINAPFVGVDQVRGPHSMQFGLPDAGVAYAVASLDGQAYYSQSGALELSLSAEGTVEGTFDISFVEDDLSGATSIAYAPNAVTTGVSGTFSGTFVVVCASPVIGFPDGHTVADTPYCQNLEL